MFNHVLFRKRLLQFLKIVFSDDLNNVTVNYDDVLRSWSMQLHGLIIIVVAGQSLKGRRIPGIQLNVIG